jgi:hypothetical protein
MKNLLLILLLAPFVAGAQVPPKPNTNAVAQTVTLVGTNIMPVAVRPIVESWFVAGNVTTQTVEDAISARGYTTTNDVLNLIPSGAGTASRFFTAEPSDVAGMYSTSDSIPTGIIAEISGVIPSSATTNETLIATWIAQARPAAYQVAEGMRQFTITARISSATDPVRLFGRICIADVNGENLVPLRISDFSTPITTLNASYRMYAAGGVRVIGPTERLVFRIYAKRLSGVPERTVTLSVDDDTYSRLDVPIPAVGQGLVAQTDPEYTNMLTITAVSLRVYETNGVWKILLPGETIP